MKIPSESRNSRRYLCRQWRHPLSDENSPSTRKTYYWEAKFNFSRWGKMKNTRRFKEFNELKKKNEKDEIIKILFVELCFIYNRSTYLFKEERVVSSQDTFLMFISHKTWKLSDGSLDGWMRRRLKLSSFTRW